jgi:hypothetical protein
MALKQLSRGSRGIIKVALVCLGIMLLGGAAIVLDRTFSDKHTPAASQQVTNPGGMPMVESYFTGRNLPPGVTEAFTCNQENANAVDEGGTLDVTKLRPCLHGWAVFQLENGKVTTVTPFGGITMSIYDTSRDTLNGVETTFTTLRTNNNRKYVVVVAAVRSKIDGGEWGEWKYASSEHENYPNGGYQAPYTYQVALALFDKNEPATAHTNLQTPERFSWEYVMLQMQQH